MSDKILDVNELQIRKFIEKNRPPEHIRSQLDIGYNYDGKTLELFDIRPKWKDSSEIINHSYAKIKYIKTKKIWKLYWMRGNGNWESYKPLSESSHLKKLLDCIDEDKHCCFKG